MARPKKPKYEWVPSKNKFRKRIKGPGGKYVAIYADTEKEMTAKLATISQQIADDEYRRDNPTVKDYADKWLEFKQSTISATSAQYYKAKVKRITDIIGDKQLADVTPDDAKSVMLSVAGMSESMYHGVLKVMRAVFESARKSHLIRENPCDDISIKGGKPQAEKKALTDDQVKTLLSAISGTPIYPFVMLALYAGLRREEILGLQWAEVHLDGETPWLEVKRVWTAIHNTPVIEERAKSKAGLRKIPIPTCLKVCLEDLRKSKPDAEYVVSNSAGQPLTLTQFEGMWKHIQNRTAEPRTFYKMINGSCVKCTITPKVGEAARNHRGVIYSIDFHVTAHQLRHTYITNLIRAGVDPKTVQYLAGHENISVTMEIYAHLNYNKPEELWSKVQSAIDKS